MSKKRDREVEVLNFLRIDAMRQDKKLAILEIFFNRFYALEDFVEDLKVIHPDVEREKDYSTMENEETNKTADEILENHIEWNFASDKDKQCFVNAMHEFSTSQNQALNKRVAQLSNEVKDKVETIHSYLTRMEQQDSEIKKLREEIEFLKDASEGYKNNMNENLH